KTGIRWCDLSTKLGFGSGPTCWRRLRDWQRVGVWGALHALLLAKLREVGELDFSRAVADSSSVRAVGAGEKLA
ncbi:transposase, partial [Robbsia andropogonis]|uniref:transposase n=1 Tax=Robbsia andropogonis TaxID=28092 RepID=UPI0034504451|nr:IS5/IS1182 family transposase [Robbsia andropogonis]MCP1131688.1 IS5/IS1182 family transposase [Robbsia andropogonis]